MCSKSYYLYIIVFEISACSTNEAYGRCTLNQQPDAECSLVLDAPFQFVDISDLGTRWIQKFQACSVKTM